MTEKHLKTGFTNSEALNYVLETDYDLQLSDIVEEVVQWRRKQRKEQNSCPK